MKNSLLKKSFSFLLAVVMLFTMVPAGVFAAESAPMIMKFTAASSGDFHSGAYYNKIYTVTILDSIDTEALNGAADSWDISANTGSGEVMAWVYLNQAATAEAKANRYDLYIAGEGGITANPSSGFLFYFLSELVEVNGLEHFKTDKATTFASMFENCYKLEKVSFKGWNTENVTSLENMFRNCYALTELDLSSFNTSKVTTMRFMFYLCKKLETIYAGSGWTTESIKNLYDGVFNCCYAKFGVTEEQYQEALINGRQFDASASKASVEDGGYLTPRPVDGLTCDEGLVVLNPESTYALTVKVNPETAYDSSLTYTSSDESIVTVDENGVITAVSEGTAKIRVYSNSEPDKSVEITVTVKNPEVPVGSVTVDKSEVNLTKGDTDKITVTVNPENATNKEVTYKSTDESVVTVDKFGNITATGEGEAEIIVTSEANKEISVSIPVKVEAKTYKVTYAFVGEVIPEDVNAPNVEVYKEGSTVFVEAEPTAEGYIFNGWTTEDADITSGSFVINNDVHIVGSWEKLYKVTYEYEEGYPVPADAPTAEMLAMLGSTQKAGDTVEKAWPITANGYIFIGWYTKDADATSNDFTMPANDVVFKGYFKKPVESIEITDGEDIVLNQDEKTRLNVYVKPEDATIKDLVYESSNPDVVTVDKYGNITAVGEGTAIVTVKSIDDPTKSDTITVKVKIPVKDITVKESDITIGKDETYKIEATVDPDATNKNLTFESSDPETVTVDKDGNITAVKDGKVTITVKSEDNPDVTEIITVTVYDPVTEITAPDEIDLELDDVKEVDAKVNDNATNKGLVYETSDSSVVKVDNYGNVVAVGEGTAIVTVISKDNPDIKKEIPVTVFKKYKVTYEIIGDVKPDGVFAPEMKEYNNGSNVNVEADLYEEGYDFSGWFTDDIAVTDGKFVIDKDVHFVGAFSKNVSDIVVDKTEITLGKGETDKITVTVTPDDATDKRVTYESSDESIVTVDKFGNITAIKDGTVTITVKSEDNPDITETVTVTVKDAVEDITVDKTEITLEEGGKDKITVTVTPDDATDKSVTYTSSDETVVKVDKDGNIEAVGEGEATITVKSNDGSEKEVTVKVTVKKTYKVTYEIIGDVRPLGVSAPASKTYDNGSTVYVSKGYNYDGYVFSGWSTDDVTVADGKFVINKDVHFTGYFKKSVTDIVIGGIGSELVIGDKGFVDVTVYPNDATDKSMTYSSSDDSVIKVDENGNFEAVGEGTATITVISKDNPDVKKEITVTVKKPVVPVDEVVVDKKFITIRNGETDKITATVKPDDATNKELIYTSSDENVVKVDKDGNIIATGEGSAVITVTLNDGNPFTDKRAQVVVTVIKAKVPVTSVEASKEEINLVPGGSETITVKVNPDDATDKTVTYKSSNPDVAKVDEKGNIVAVGEGEAIITITSKDDPTKTDTVKVTVKAPEEPDVPEEPDEPSYTFDVPDMFSLFVGENKNLGIVITPDDGKIKPVYTSGDESIITVDADGNIKALKAGVTTISVDLGVGGVVVVPVTVLAVPTPPRKHHICFGKTDGIGWYEVSVNGGDFFPQGPNSTLEVDEGSILVVRVQDMWIDDEFDFYVNGSKVPMDPANTITVVVDGYMLIGALSMDTEVPDVDESLTLLEKITNFFAKIINWFKNLFK